MSMFWMEPGNFANQWLFPALQQAPSLISMALFSIPLTPPQNSIIPGPFLDRVTTPSPARRMCQIAVHHPQVRKRSGNS